MPFFCVMLLLAEIYFFFHVLVVVTLEVEFTKLFFTLTQLIVNYNVLKEKL